jgi:hypothetical protein
MFPSVLTRRSTRRPWADSERDYARFAERVTRRATYHCPGYQNMASAERGGDHAAASRRCGARSTERAAPTGRKTPPTRGQGSGGQVTPD